MKRSEPGVRRRCFLSVSCFEVLERRLLLHGGIAHDDGVHSESTLDGLDPEIVATMTRRVLAGEDAAAYVGTPYDPHVLGVQTGDEILTDPMFLTSAPPSLALPDMIPWAGPNGNNYFHNIQFDTFSIPGRKLMRFSTAIANAGDGPVELLAGETNPDGTQKVYQRLYNFDWDTRVYTVNSDRLAGNFIYHAGHNHLHFEGYAEYRLLTNVNGEVGGPAYRSDGTEVLGEKVGFCLINVTTYNANHPGYNTSPSGYGCGNRQGISVGRADVYSSGLDAQWVDVTGVPAGQYFLEVTLDVGGAVQESDETNNTIRVPVTISAGGGGGGVQPDRFDAIAPNNSFATATDFGELGDRTEATLTLHATYDEDFYRFVATSDGSITIQLPHSGGNPDLFLYDGNQEEIARSTRASGTESLTANLTAGGTYYIHVNLFQSQETLVEDYALLIDGPLPTVFADAPVERFNEGSSMTFDVVRNGPILAPLNVPIQFSGTATYGVDYTASATAASFGAEADRVTITINAIKDAVKEGEETIIITLASGSAYVVGTDPTTHRITERGRLGGDGRIMAFGGSFDPLTPGLFPESPSEALFAATPLLELAGPESDLLEA